MEATFDILIDMIRSAWGSSCHMNHRQPGQKRTKCHRLECIEKLLDALRGLLDLQHDVRPRSAAAIEGSCLSVLPTHLLQKVMGYIGREDQQQSRLVCREFAAAAVERMSALHVDIDQLYDSHSPVAGSSSRTFYDIPTLIAFAEFITRPDCRRMATRAVRLRSSMVRGTRCDIACFVLPTLGLIAADLQRIDIDVWIDEGVAEALAMLLQWTPMLRSLRCKFASSNGILTVGSSAAIGLRRLKEMRLELHLGLEPVEDVHAVTDLVASSGGSELRSLCLRGCSPVWALAAPHLLSLATLKLRGLSMDVRRWQRMFDVLPRLGALTSFEVTDPDGCAEGRVVAPAGLPGGLRRMVISLNECDSISFELEDDLPTMLEHLELRNIACIGCGWGVALGRLSTLRTLVLESNSFQGTDVPRALAGLRGLEELRFVANPLGLSGIGDLVASIRTLPRLVALDLGQSIQCRGAVDAVAPFLAACGGHVRVCMEDNNFGHEGISALMTGVLMKRDAPSSQWYLAGNGVGADVSEFIMMSLGCAWGRSLDWGY